VSRPGDQETVIPWASMLFILRPSEGDPRTGDSKCEILVKEDGHIWLDE